MFVQQEDMSSSSTIKHVFSFANKTYLRIQQEDISPCVQQRVSLSANGTFLLAQQEDTSSCLVIKKICLLVSACSNNACPCWDKRTGYLVQNEAPSSCSTRYMSRCVSFLCETTCLVVPQNAPRLNKQTCLPVEQEACLVLENKTCILVPKEEPAYATICCHMLAYACMHG